jgi:pyridoxal 5'-phosphate synthase pdxT subunit
MTEQTDSSLLIGVLALQGAFEEHEACLRAVGCRTKQVRMRIEEPHPQETGRRLQCSNSSYFVFQVRTVQDLQGIDGIVLPGGESTAMGLIGTTSSSNNLWQELQTFSQTKPTWGTCAGMILLAKQCVGGSGVIQNGQALIGGVDILVCRNYFGSQISSFEMATPAPPRIADTSSYPGVFIRAPAILSAGEGVKVLGTVVATPCSKAHSVLQELESKIEQGGNIVIEDEKKEAVEIEAESIRLPGAAEGSNARNVISAVQKDHLLCTAFHPELTQDYRWHEYFVKMVKESKKT